MFILKKLNDLRKFYIISATIEPYFKPFSLSHPKEIWVIAEERRSYLQGIGIDTTKMVKSLEIAKQIVND
jgi:hypothetical protein